MQTFKNWKITILNRVENQAGERKSVATARLSDLHRTAVPTVSGFVRVFKTQKVVTTLIDYLQNWVETYILKLAFLKGFKRRRGYIKSQNLKVDFW